MMSTTLFEKSRCKYVEIERLERLVMKELETEQPCSRDRLLSQGHSLRRMVKSIMHKSETLVETFEDTCKAIDDEIAPLGDQTDAFSLFSQGLQKIHEYHRDNGSGGLVVDANEEDFEALLKEETVSTFTREEGFPRYLDLHDMYNQYINSEFGERVEYSAYLDVLSQAEKIPRNLKLSSQYKKYMEALLDYLTYFFEQTQRLQDLDVILSKVESEFEEQYADRKVEDGKEIALTEAKGKKLCNLLDETIKRTKQNVEKKHALTTFEEMEEEREGEEDGQAPIGWDGKPIPQLLYKLHDLGHEFTCEICGNFSYWGKRNFERHFKEWRHLCGINKLGIPNTKNFNEITSIGEAKELWKRIQETQ